MVHTQFILDPEKLIGVGVFLAACEGFVSEAFFLCSSFDKVKTNQPNLILLLNLIINVFVLQEVF